VRGAGECSEEHQEEREGNEVRLLGDLKLDLSAQYMVSRMLRMGRETGRIGEGRAHVPARVVGVRYNSTPIFRTCYEKSVVEFLPGGAAVCLQVTRGVRIVAASGYTGGQRCCGATASIKAMARSEQWVYEEGRKRPGSAVL
jgi:hypothetical protein